MKYFPLRIKTDYSILYGFGTIDEYLEKSKSLGINTIGVAERFTMSSLYSFYIKAKEKDIKLIPGCEFLLKEGDMNYKITLYAKNHDGLVNLFKLMEQTYRNKESYSDKESFAYMDDLKEHSNGVICLTGYEDTYVEKSLNCEKHLLELKEIYEDDLYLSLFKMSDKTLRMSKEYNIKIIPSHEVLFTEEEHKLGCDMFMAKGSSTNMNETSSLFGGKRLESRANNVYVRKNSKNGCHQINEELYLNDIVEDEYYNNLKELADKVDVEINYDSHLRPHFDLEEGKTEIDAFKELVFKGFKEKRANTRYEKESKRKIQEELDTIWGNDYLSYFLVVEDYCRYARENAGGIGTGRGSVGGSEIAYLMGIHDTDPIRHELLFERFLSPGRGSEFTIYYKDGTEETSMMSEKHEVNGVKKYTHQLEKGDIVNGKTIKDIKMTRPSASSVDVDTDFNTEGRKKVLDYVKEKYGEDKVSNVMRFGVFKAKSTLKMIGQVFSLSASKMNKIKDVLTDDNLRIKDLYTDPDLAEFKEGYIEWLDSFEDVYNFDPKNVNLDILKGKYTRIPSSDFCQIKIKDLMEIYAPIIEGRISDEGIHPCGVIISSKDISDTVPTQLSNKNGALMTQWDYGSCEAIGLIKMDFLGLDTVDIIENALKYIRENKGINLTKDKILNSGLDDKETYEVFKNAYTTTIFQYSSEGVKEFLLDLKPDNFKDLFAVTALYRPGPMGMNAHHSFAKRKRGEERPIPFDNIKLVGTKVDRVLSDVYGLIPFQESLMTLARECAGFTPYETDLLRKATGKKIYSQLEKLRPKFLKGIQKTVNDELKVKLLKKYGKNKEVVLKEYKKRALNKNDLEQIWANIEGFASYSFNKSHSVSYALNAYTAAFLKTHFPTEYMAAAISQVSQGSTQDKKEKLREYVDETKRMGVKINPPNINESTELTIPKGNELYLGFDVVANVGSKLAEEIVKERINNGIFQNISDYAKRMKDLNSFDKRSFSSLASVGAFECLGESRKGLVESFPDIKNYVDKYAKGTLPNTSGLFSFMDENNSANELILDKDEYSYLEIMALEYDTVGFFISGHPLDKINFGEINNVGFKVTENEMAKKKSKKKEYKTRATRRNSYQVPDRDGFYKNNFYTYPYLMYVSDISTKRTKYGKSYVKIELDSGRSVITASPGMYSGFWGEPITSTGKRLEKGQVYILDLSYYKRPKSKRASINVVDAKKVILNKDGTFKEVLENAIT